MRADRLRESRPATLVSLGIGVAGLIGAGIAIGLEPARGLYAYLFAFTYWVGLAIASLLLLTIWHASQARWPVVIRRFLEASCSTLVAFPLLFIPILAGSSAIFPFRAPDSLDESLRHHVEHQQPYLNMAFWCVRAFVYFAALIGISESLRRFSLRQDDDPDLGWTLKQRRLGTAGLPLVALLISFVALDWIMSLQPTWSSTIFGLYYFTGSFVSALALLTVITVVARREAPFDELLNQNHLASLGKMMFAFVCFWAYIAFDQYMLVWIADIPGENEWYILRASGSWGAIAVAILVGQFVLPFFLLLSRELKTHRPWLLFAVALLVLLAHALDVYWMVLPAIDREGLDVHWQDPIAFLGVGGIVVALGLWRLRGGSLYPVGDPYLQESIRYRGS